MTTTRYARRYSDGSFNVGSHEENYDLAIKRLSGSTDDDDTELVLVKIEIIRSLGRKLKVVATDPVRDALAQALDCLRGETPEDCSRKDALADTIEKVRDALRTMEGSCP